jgi:hypothetical protein
MVIAVVRGGFNLVQQVQRKGSHCAWERGHRALGDATRARRPRAVQVHAGKMPTAPALGARASGAHASEDMPPACRRARRPRSIQVHARETPALRSGSWVARASGAHISSVCPGCARLRRAYQQRLPWVRAPPAHTRAGRPRSVQVHGCVRLRRAYQQRLPWVRAPPARMPARTCLRRRAVALRLRARASCPRRRDAHETPALCPD